MPPRVGSFILSSVSCLCCRMVSSFSCPCLMRCRRAVVGVVFLVFVIVFSFLGCLFRVGGGEARGTGPGLPSVRAAEPVVLRLRIP